jgi:PknH-like extracellular domain
VQSVAIQLASETAAHEFFEISVQQRKHCAGRTAVITKEDRIHIMWTIELGSVEVSGRLLTANSSWRNDTPQPAVPEARVLGFASNVIVEVAVGMDPYHGPPAPVGDKAIKAADEMLRKVTQTS